jgi:UDP-N-acetylmuramyl pentapeptide phosphotransferase/UDP-N-acetylglucosamine-1-phosphate transferase
VTVLVPAGTVRAGPGPGGPALAGVAAGVSAAGAARLAYRVLTRLPPGGEKAWARVNHRGEPVTLLEGPAAATGAVLMALALSGLSQSRFPALSPAERIVVSRSFLALAAAGGGAAAFGALDDLKGSGKRRGLRGHLGALAHGEVTTGAVKLAGIGATGVAGALLLRRPGESALDCAVNAGLIAGAANLLNLFDLRPGRAIKVAALSAGMIGAASAAAGGGGRGIAAVAVPAGAALAVLPEDLGERAMLGDAGANALGAMLGVAAVSSLGGPARAGVLAGIVALTAASEKVSFTKVIARTPALNWLDMLGRVPPGDTNQSPGSPAVTGALRSIRLSGGTPRDHGSPPRLPGSLEAALAAARSASRATRRVLPGDTNQSPGPPAVTDARPSIRLLTRWRSLRRAGSLSVLSGDKRRSPGHSVPG